MSSFIDNHRFPSSKGDKFKGAMLAHTCGKHVISLNDNDFANTYTKPYGAQLSMSAQPMLNAAIRSHFNDLDYVNVFCEGGVCNNNIVTVRDKCSGFDCNKDYCDGISLEGLDPGVVPAISGTIGGTIGIFILMIIFSCCCRPK